MEKHYVDIATAAPQRVPSRILPGHQDGPLRLLPLPQNFGVFKHITLLGWGDILVATQVGEASLPGRL